MRILITGGAGFIGSYLTAELCKRGHNVRVMDNFSNQIHGANPKKKLLFGSTPAQAEIIVGDVESLSDWKKCLTEIDTVVHLAAETGTGQSMYETHRYVNVNVSGTAHLLDLVMNDEVGVSKLIIASSRAVYGEGKYEDAQGNIHYPKQRLEHHMKQGFFNPVSAQNGQSLKPLATDEQTPFSATSIYGLTKQMQEEMILLAAKVKGISGIALRYQNVYGPGQSLNNPYTGIISIFSKLLLNNKPINIFEDGEESRDFVFISDAVNATVNAIELEKPIVDSFNVGSGVQTSVLKVAEVLKQYYESSSELNISGNFRLGDIRHNFAELSRVSKTLSFQPKIDIKQGLQKIASWVTNLQIEPDGSYLHSLKEMEKRGLFK